MPPRNLQCSPRIVKHTDYKDTHRLALIEKVYILSFHSIAPKSPNLSKESTDIYKQKVKHGLVNSKRVIISIPYKSILDRHCTMYLVTSLNFARHRMSIKFCSCKELDVSE